MLSKAQSKPLSRELIPKVRPKLSALERGLLRWSMAESGDKVLDANVGGGLLLDYLQRHSECEICGMSDEMESVREARSLLQNADIVYAACDDIPWREDTFDSVYIKARQLTDKALSEALRVLKPGGQLLIGARWQPSPLKRLAALTRDDAEPMPDTGSEMRQRLSNLGFQQITWQFASMTSMITIGWKPARGFHPLDS